MKEVLKIGIVLAGVAIVHGCQKGDDESDTPPPSSAIAEQPDTTAEAPTTTDSPTDSDAVADAPAEDSELVARVKELMLIRTVEETDTGIEISFILEQAATVNDKSPPQDVSDAMMFATFYTGELLYSRLPSIDGLELVFIYKQKPVGEIRLTRESYASLGYQAAIRGAADQPAKRRVYRKLLKELPKGAVRIDKKYRP